MNAKFSEEISEKMKVPKRIVMSNNHEMQVDNHEILNGNGMNSWNYYEKLDMTVPDRIVVIGQDQHLGTKSAPREIMLDNSILESGLKSKDPEYFRVSTPPRVITLSEHHFPSASDEPEEDEETRYFEPKNVEFSDEARKNQRNARKMHQNPQEIVINHREGTPQFGSGIGSVENLSTAHDDVMHLKKQVNKLNRRLLNVEIEIIQRAQRDKIICGLGILYFVIKAFVWINRK